jgi:deoxyribonuclease V
MPVEPLHGWDVMPRAAIALQQQLRERVRVEPFKRSVQTIAGADISFNRFSDQIFTGIVVLRLVDLQVVEEVGLQSTAKFPYVPGLLSFRELPSLLEAWERLTIKPDVLMLDGQGLAHPRRFGIACHAGVWLDLPAFGCAKSILVGSHEDLPVAATSQVPLMDKGEQIGVALRTKKNVKPIYVSVGHRMDLAGAVALTLRTITKYRQPEPTRQAHLLVNRLRCAATNASLI